MVADQVTMVIEPDPSGDYLSSLDPKQRHEVRRKRRRYQERMGPIQTATSTGGEGFERFSSLHRLAPGRKGSFLAGKRLDFFADLAAQPGWRIDELVAGGRSLACLFGYHDQEGYYLYNSAYHPDAAELSPGIVLLTEAIVAMFDSGVPRVDFLKGGEEYKARLGAEPRRLFTVEA